MKTLFFIAALAGAVYLIMQTPAGQAWLQENEPELDTQQTVEKVKQTITPIQHSIENKVTELTPKVNHIQQAQIEQLEARIAELENELIMGRIAQNQQQSITDGVVTLHPYNQNKATLPNSATQQSIDLNPAPPAELATMSDTQLQRQRQARLQDIADKMEMSSLQALLN